MKGKHDGKTFKKLAGGRPGRGAEGARERRRASSRAPTARRFFAMFLQNVLEGYFSDPIYGGNKDMAAWKMIGFPGAHYDYRQWVGRHGERVPYRAGQHQGPARLVGGLKRWPRNCRRSTPSWSASAGPAPSSASNCATPGSRSWRSSAASGATRPPISRPTFAQDELRYMWRHHLFQNLASDTLTIRNNTAQQALPMRRLGSFLLGTGVGGAGVHWNAQIWRFLESDLKALQPQPERYGAGGGRRLRHDGAGLPADLERDRAALRRLRQAVRHLGQGRQPERPAAGRRQPVRRAALGRIPEPAAGDAATAPTLFAKAAAEKGYKPFPASGRQRLARLRQSARLPARAMHLLRLLREVRLRQLLQGDGADDDPAVPDDEAQLHACAPSRRCSRWRPPPTASAPPASPTSTAPARSSSSRPRSWCSRPTCCRTCG